MFEIEKRGFLTKEKYGFLLDFLSKNAQDLGDDDKDVVYYIFSDKLLKVVNNLSKGDAKISLKANKIGKGSVFPETEAHFKQNDFNKIKLIIDAISNPERIMSGIQKRRNFIYKNCEIAVKWSKEWNYHFEIEKVVEDEISIKEAETQLELLAEELGIKIMNDQELKEFTDKAEKDHDKSVESKNNQNKKY